jgi:hypothetical protein
MEDSVFSRNYCKDVLPIPQFLGTCWFNALLMSLFYSELTRNFFIQELPNIRKKLKKKTKVIEILEDLLFNNYRVNEKNNTHFYDAFRPENILRELNKADGKLFYAKESIIKRGFNGPTYIDQLFRFLNVKDRVLYLKANSLGKYAVSVKNSNVTDIRIGKNNMFFVNYEPLFDLPKTNARYRFLLLNGLSPLDNQSFGDLSTLKMHDKIDIISLDIVDSFSPPEVLIFKNARFILDSMMISNFNNTVCGRSHQIAGITCKSKKYLYNGWTNNTKDPAKKNSNETEKLKDELVEVESKLEVFEKRIEAFIKKDKLTDSDYQTLSVIKFRIIELDKESTELKRKLEILEPAETKPCNLVRYDWNTEDSNFCIDLKKCEYPKKTTNSDLCFNVKKGNRAYLYVRETIKNLDTKSVLNSILIERKTPKAPIKATKQCPLDKILNPETDRCVSRTGAKGKELVKKEKAKSPSPPPKTKKQCPPDKILNPETDRCVSRTGAKGKELVKKEQLNTPSPPPKTTKQCPPDKILNPETDRCVSRTGAKGKELVKKEKQHNQK